MKYDPKIHHRRSIRLPNYDYSREGAYFITICTHQREPLFGEIIDGETRLSNLGKIARWHWQNLIKIYPYLRLDEFVIMPDHLHGILILDDAGFGSIDLESSRGVGTGLYDDPGSSRGLGAGFGDFSLGIENLSKKPAPTGGSDDRGLGAGFGDFSLGIENLSRKPAPTGGSDDRGMGAGFGDFSLGIENLSKKPAPTGGSDDRGMGAGLSDDSGVLFAGQRKGIPEIIRGYKTFSARQINRARRGAKIPVWQRNYYERIIRDERELHNVRQYIIDNPKKSHPSPSPENRERSP